MDETKFIPIKKEKHNNVTVTMSFPPFPPFEKQKAKHGVLTAQKLLTIQISEKIYPRQKSKNITGLLSWSFRCLTPPSQPPSLLWLDFCTGLRVWCQMQPKNYFRKKRKKNEENSLIITHKERNSCLAFHS